MNSLKRLASVVFALGLASAPQAQADIINAGVATTTFANAVTFSFTFTVPTALTGLVSYSATLGGTLTDLTGNGISVSPVGGFIIGGLINGIAVGNDALGTLTTNLASQPVFSGTFDCGAACNSIALLLHYTLSAQDSAAFSANFTVVSDSVPEPGTLFLLGIGLAGLLFARMRLQRRIVGL